jgi:hypothetical protein
MPANSLSFAVFIGGQPDGFAFGGTFELIDSLGFIRAYLVFRCKVVCYVDTRCATGCMGG